MIFEDTGFAGLVRVRPERHGDERGHFVRTFCTSEFANRGLVSFFPQTSLSFNTASGTVRGMHFSRAPHAETKLVRCTRGTVFDVVVDLRSDQLTYLTWQGFELSATNGEALYIPEGFAHGFQTLRDECEVAYAITPSFVAGSGDGVRWDDPAIGVEWPRAISVISVKDQNWPLLGADPGPRAQGAG